MVTGTAVVRVGTGGAGGAGGVGGVSGDDEPSICCSLKSVRKLSKRVQGQIAPFYE